MALFHIKFQSIPSLILFTLTDNPQFYGLEVSLNNIFLIVGFFRSNNRTIIFSNREKKIISKQTHTGPYIYDVHIEVGWAGKEGLKFYQVFAIFF